MENTNYTYDVFISYSRSDYMKDDPDNLIVSILKLFDENKVKYFFDQDAVTAGDEYAAIITNAIIESETFLFISTESANSSIWTSKEIALAHHYNKKIIPVRADMSFYNSSIVFYLADIDYIDGSDKNKVLERLSKSIVAPIKERIELKEKEENEKREQEERKKAEKKQEQERLISSIRLDIAQIESDEKSIDITKEKIKLQICKVENQASRDELSSMLNLTRSADKSLQHQIDELEERYRIDTERNMNEINNVKLEAERYRQEAQLYRNEIERMRIEFEKHRSEPKPQNEKRTSKFLGIFKAHSLITNVIFFITALTLVIMPIIHIRDTNVGNETSLWICSMIACSLIAESLLVLMLCRRRINIVVHIVMIAAFAVLAYFENGYAMQFGYDWPTTYLAEDIQRYIPISLTMAAAYILGALPFLIKVKKG